MAFARNRRRTEEGMTHSRYILNDVADEKINDEGTQLMRTLNLKIRDDQRVSAVMLTLGDGLTVVRKL
jgi:predicted O-methyltransferase YrrM